MNILFWVRKNYVTRKGTAQIICSLSIDGKKIDIGTKLALEVKNWKQAKQRAYGENSLFINEAIAKIKTQLIQIKQGFELQGKIYTLQDIKNEFLGKNIKIEIKSLQTTILQDLEKVQNIRAKNNSDTTNQRDKSYFHKFRQFLEKNNLINEPTEKISKTDILNFLDNIKGNATTYNNYLTFLKAVFNVMLQREMICKNPCEGIKKQRARETKSVAFTPEHTKILAQACKEYDTELYVFCMCIFYTFIRPLELRRLKVGQIDLEKQKIYIDGTQSKNKKSEYVVIPDVLKNIFLETKFLERNPNDFLFSDNKNLHYSRNKYSEAFAKICRALDMPKNYSLYCWKHTGVVAYYNAGAKIKFIQMQCRHSSLDETNKYLKDLGLFENDNIFENAPEI